jgi:hypothetical protein
MEVFNSPITVIAVCTMCYASHTIDETLEGMIEVKVKV